MKQHCFRLVPPFALLFLVGCGSAGTGMPGDSGDYKVDLAFQPDPPTVGPAEVVLSLKDKEGRPAQGAKVRLERNMNHAGMEPVFAEASEAEPGTYKAALKFTMGGDWFVLVDATLSDGRKVKRKVDVRGVKSR